jgi:glutathione synthase/RimK-type ligase-like ATP-grasp enzyme
MRGSYSLKKKSINGKSVKTKYKSREVKIAEKLKNLQKSGVYIGSKWIKTNVLLRNPFISRFIPKTKKLKLLVLKTMLDEFKMVYIKPINGTYGIGVMRVEKQKENGHNTFNYQQGTVKRHFSTLPALYRSIMKSKMKREYIAQQGIHLLKYNSCLFDLRIMVQKNLKGVWETTGIIGRVAHPKKIVTNYHSGGTPSAFNKIFKPYLSKEQIHEYNQILSKFGQDVAVAMSKKYPKLNMLGIDVGVDKKLYPWIIEVNTNPDLYIFKKLKNKAIFQKMYRYAKHLKRA